MISSILLRQLSKLRVPTVSLKLAVGLSIRSGYIQQYHNTRRIRTRGDTSMPSVPNITQVTPGAAVSIVLKADQPTGREVQGTVQNVLTKGNHPRGIKVRLSDGRVGRVQRMYNGELPASASQQQPSGSSERPQRTYKSNRFITTDVRNEDGGGQPTEEIDLFSYVKPAKQKKRGQKGQQLDAAAGEAGSVREPEVGTATATCPVCGVFEGDEAAVAHHVETHFS